MTPTFEDAANLGTEFLDQGLKSLSAVTKAAHAISGEAAAFAKKSMEDGAATVEQLLSADSVDEAAEVQVSYARSAYEGFVAEATKMAELYADMARDAYKPYESIIAKPR